MHIFQVHIWFVIVLEENQVGGILEPQIFLLSLLTFLYSVEFVVNPLRMMCADSFQVAVTDFIVSIHRLQPFFSVLLSAMLLEGT